jgi:formylglycine-generating enzyme required for sulfatase activity/S1-C subfamily serine protease
LSATPLRSEGSKHRLQAGGTLNPRRHLYIERPDDQTLLKLLSEGQYVNVLTSRQMGKSSLMVRTAQALTDQGVRCAIVDLAAELGTPENAATYFLGILSKIVRDLKVELDLKAWWAERPEDTANQRLMRFFREVVSEQVQGPVVCFLDEIDSTLNPKLIWTDDLFTALRGMHNERALVPAYEGIAFCLIGVVAPDELIKDRRTTPYNIGRTLELKDFHLAHDDLSPVAAALAQDGARGRALVERVLYWTGGHPYLTIRLCVSLRDIGAETPEDVDRRVEDSFRSLERLSNDVHFQQVLRFLETRLTDGLATFALYERVLNGARERDQTTLAHTQLKLSGLVKRDDEGCLAVRNRIYERLFDHRWVESTKPKRTVQAYRRWAIAASIAFVILAAAATGTITYLESQLSERERLAGLGVTVTSASGGAQINFPNNTSQALLEETAPLLKAVGPVTVLSLSGTEVTDLSPLASLTSLQLLDLSGTGAADLAPLASLTNLRYLALRGTRVVDVMPLADLTSLRALDLRDTQVADVSPLSLGGLQLLGPSVDAPDMDPTPLWGREFAFDLIAMLDVRAARPDPDTDDFIIEPAGEGEIGQYGAAIIVGRADRHVYLATAEHVAFPSHLPPTRVDVRFNFFPERRFPAEALRRDEELDLAVLRVAETPELAQALDRVDFARVRPPELLLPDDKLRTIGNPEGNAWYSPPFELDLFDSLDGPELRFHTRLLLTGHSGGGLFTEDWYLVGMVRTERQPFGKALRIDQALSQLGKWGYPVALSMPLPPEAPRIVQDCPDCPELIEVPPGEFMMGADPQERDQSGNERPRHAVKIGAPLLVGRYEVTHEQFATFVGATGYAPGLGCEIWTSNDRSWRWDRDKDWRDPGYPVEDPMRPVVCTSWDDAAAYLAWLSRITGQRYRLPSEAEWEYAARAWTQTSYWWGDHLPPGRAACDGCGSPWDLSRAAPVGRFPANPFGLYDVHGNVWEWVQDCWHDTYLGAPADGRAWNEDVFGDCERRMMRGGSSISQPETLRAANRLEEKSSHRKSDVSFRVAREP